MSTEMDATQRELANTVRQLLRTHAPVAAAHGAYDKDEVFDADLWRRLRDELGVLGLGVPEELGGLGAGHLELGIIVAELGRVLARTPFLISSAVVAPTLARLAADSRAAAVTAGRLAAGDLIATAALWEDAPSWDAAQTSVMLLDGVVNGRKTAVPFAAQADVVMVPVRDGRGELGLALVRTADVTVAVTQSLDRTTPLSIVTFENAPAEVVAVGDRAESALAYLFNCGAVHRANEMIAGAEVALDGAVSYAQQREQFGRPIGSQQAIKHLCADVLVSIEMARGPVEAATSALDDSGLDSAELTALVSLAKAMASDMFLGAADAALHVHGGMGFTWEHDSHLFLRRARAANLDFGDARFHRERFLSGSPLTRTSTKGSPAQ